MKVYVCAPRTQAARVLALHAKLISLGHTPTASWPALFPTLTSVATDQAETLGSDVAIWVQPVNGILQAIDTAVERDGMTLAAGTIVVLNTSELIAAFQAGGTLAILDQIRNTIETAWAAHLAQQQAMQAG